MTTKQDVESALIGFVLTAYNTAFPACPIVWGNMPFDYNAPPDVYVESRVSLEHTEGLAVNSPLDRHYGNIYFTVIVKAGIGTMVANQVADYLFKAYRHQSVSGIEIRDAKMAGEGAAHDGYEIRLMVPFVTSPL